MTRPRTTLGIATILLMCVVIGAALIALGPCVHVSVKRELVGPEEEAVVLLAREDVPLDQIQAAVQRSGKQVDQISYRGGTLLYHSVRHRRADVVQWLLREGANPNGTWNGYGGVPLVAAIRKEDEAMVRLLMAAGANPELEMQGGITPRGYAQEHGNRALLAILSSRGDPLTRLATQPGNDK